MQNTKHRNINKRFIVSSLSKVSGSIDYLSYLARQAFYARDYSRLAAIGEELINLSPMSEATGQYFVTLANSRYGQRAREATTKAITQLADSPLDHVRAASLITLSGFDFLDLKPSRTTVNILQEASRLAHKRDCLVTYIQAQSGLSIAASIDGDHKTSFRLLEALFPAVRSIKWYPQLVETYINDLAYELSCTGKIEAAHQLITGITKSPSVRLYPEWLETAEEIREKYVQLSVNRSKVFAPQKIFTSADEYREPVNFYFRLIHNGHHQQLLTLPLDITEESTEYLLYIFKSLDAIGTDENTGIQIIGFLSDSDDLNITGYKKNIHLKMLNWLYVFIRNERNKLKNNSPQTKAIPSYPLPKDNPMIQKILEKFRYSLLFEDGKSQFGIKGRA
jgi:hypothetical protein